MSASGAKADITITVRPRNVRKKFAVTPPNAGVYRVKHSFSR
jgi:hypothetical protein